MISTSDRSMSSKSLHRFSISHHSLAVESRTDRVRLVVRRAIRFDDVVYCLLVQFQFVDKPLSPAALPSRVVVVSLN